MKVLPEFMAAVFEWGAAHWMGAPKGALEPAERDRRQAPAHRAEGARRHRRLVQHARVLPWPQRGRAALGEMDLPPHRVRIACDPARNRVADAGVFRPIRGADARALVFLRSGEPSAESLLPGGVLR